MSCNKLQNGVIFNFTFIWDFDAELSYAIKIEDFDKLLIYIVSN